MHRDWNLSRHRYEADHQYVATRCPGHSVYQLPGRLPSCHIAAELWQQLGHETLLVDIPWPEADDSLLVDQNVTIAVQVNGKLRGTIELAKDIAREDAEAAALGLPRVQEAMNNKPARKVIVVPNRIINVVV